MYFDDTEPCTDEHRYDPYFDDLPQDQSHFNGRHKCAGCAYEEGYQMGLARERSIHINFDELPNSQAGTIRHKSVQAAFAKGYSDGILESYR
ncbi:MAG: hypothetical protein ACRC7D_20885 [Aeromonas popoffii]|uniref:hypothetical protein n=1 Tax=Aeromonas popoffii TaxID=70856 RepID=UPI003F3AEF68